MLTRINGHLQFFRRIATIRKIGPYSWLIETECHGAYEVWGGRKSGGSSRDWFVEPADGSWQRAIPVCSMVEGIKLVDGM